jgi:hypothetical protein
VAYTSAYHPDKKQKVYGGVVLPHHPRGWDIGQMPSDECRQDVGVGHLLHFAAMVDEQAEEHVVTTALVCPAMVKLRPGENINVALEDMPEDYTNSTQFAVAVIQAKDSRKLIVRVSLMKLCHRASSVGSETRHAVVQRPAVRHDLRLPDGVGRYHSGQSPRVH